MYWPGLRSLCVQQYDWSKQSACNTNLDENAMARSIVLGSKNVTKGGDLSFSFSREHGQGATVSGIGPRVSRLHLCTVV